MRDDKHHNFPLQEFAYLFTQKGERLHINVCDLKKIYGVAQNMLMKMKKKRQRL